MNIFNKKISLESGKCYLAENYPESGFYEQMQTDTKYKDFVMVDKDSGLCFGFSTNKSVLNLFESMVKEQAQGLIEEAIYKKVKECNKEIEIAVKDHNNEIIKLKKHYEKRLNENMQAYEKETTKLSKELIDAKKGLSEDFALKMLSIAIKNDKVKDL